MNGTMQTEKPSSPKTKLIFGVVFLVAVLATAAFVAGKWMKSDMTPIDQTYLKSDGVGEDTIVSGQGTRIDVEPAKELPQYAPDTLGMFVKRDDNSIYVGTGNYGVTLGDNGPIANYDGPLVEVVITQKTQIYREETEYPTNPSSGEAVQQKVGYGSLDEIIDGSQAIGAWGHKVGDRLIANVLYYTPPWIPKKPPGR